MGQGPITLRNVETPKTAAVSADGKFPAHVHKADGEHKEVANAEELAAAINDGWEPDLHALTAPPKAAKVAKAAKPKAKAAPKPKKK